MLFVIFDLDSLPKLKTGSDTHHLNGKLEVNIGSGKNMSGFSVICKAKTVNLLSFVVCIEVPFANRI